MADFIIIVATLAAIASPSSPEAPGAGLGHAPTLGFHLYPSLEACAAAVSENTVPPGSRLVCVPVEPPPGGLTNTH
jgi:hypothetical protein